LLVAHIASHQDEHNPVQDQRNSKTQQDYADKKAGQIDAVGKKQVCQYRHNPVEVTLKCAVRKHFK
jgi:hypothetical protein